MKEVSYTVRGVVEKGYAQAGKQGYPTANLKLDHLADIPHGIYCAWTTIDGGEERIPSVVFHGIPHALPDVAAPRFEVHLLSGEHDLYEKELTVELIAFVRENKKFSDRAQLETAIKNDIKEVKEYFKTESRPTPG